MKLYYSTHSRQNKGKKKQKDRSQGPVVLTTKEEEEEEEELLDSISLQLGCVLLFKSLLLNSEKTMKRGRKSKVSKGGKELGEEQNTTYSGLPITELPRSISVDILLRLPADRLLACRCVCKTWRSLISDPQFAKLHFAKGEVVPLIRSLSRVHVNRTLYLVDPPLYTGFMSDYGRRRFSDCSCDENWVSCEVHRNRKLDAKIKIPLRNSDLALNTQHEAEEDVKTQSNRGKRKRCIKLEGKDHRFNVANTCRGLLCLSEPIKNDPVVVCNPITGEYLNLPVPTKDKDDPKKSSVDCALGFSPQTNQYKVIRMYSLEFRDSELIQEPITGEKIFSCRLAEINILGTSTWRQIGYAPSSCEKLRFPTYLNGALHWLYSDHRTLDYIISFDIVNEKFRRITPPCNSHLGSYNDISLGVLGGCLCMCFHDYDFISVWVMEDYDDPRSWTKKHNHTTTTNPDSRWLWGLHEPISVVSNGGLLFFHHRSSALLIYRPDGMDFKYVKIRGVKSKYEAIAFAPSFISLKELVEGEELEVANINSRCARLKLLGETKTLYSEEADANFDSDLNPSSYNNSGADDCESS